MPGFDPPKPPNFQRGQRQLSAMALNQLRELALRHIAGGGDTNVSYFGDRLTITSKTINPQLPDPTNYLRQFIVLEELPDCLVCTPMFYQPGDEGGWSPQSYEVNLTNPTMISGAYAIIWVAKPYFLQQTPWDQSTVPLPDVVQLNGHPVKYIYDFAERTREAQFQDGTPWETQEITPSYVLGDVIVAVRTLTGYTDNVWHKPVVWMDANNAARKWLKNCCENSIWVEVTGQDTTPTFTVTQFQLDSNIVTLEASGTLPFNTGVVLNLADNSATYLNGNQTITTVTGTSITFNLTHANVPVTSDSGTLTPTILATLACAWHKVVQIADGSTSAPPGGPAGTFVASYPGPFSAVNPLWNLDVEEFPKIPCIVRAWPGPNHGDDTTPLGVTGTEYATWWMGDGSDTTSSAGFILTITDGITADTVTGHPTINFIGSGDLLVGLATGGGGLGLASDTYTFYHKPFTVWSYGFVSGSIQLIAAYNYTNTIVAGYASDSTTLWGGIDIASLGSTSISLTFVPGGVGGSLQYTEIDSDSHPHISGSPYIYVTGVSSFGGGTIVIDGSHTSGNPASISLIGLTGADADPDIIPYLSLTTIGSDSLGWISGRINGDDSHIEFGVDAAVDDGFGYIALRDSFGTGVIKIGTRIDGGAALGFYQPGPDGIVRQPNITGNLAGNDVLRQIMQALGQGDGSGTLKGVNLLQNSTSDGGTPTTTFSGDVTAAFIVGDVVTITINPAAGIDSTAIHTGDATSGDLTGTFPGPFDLVLFGPGPVSIPLAKITPVTGTDGSIDFDDKGRLSAYVAPT